MIETGVITVLRSEVDIKARTSAAGVGERIYLGRVPQGVAIDGGTIVVSKSGAERDYALAEEAGSKFTTVQIDCYDLMPTAADSLAELVAAALSGEAAIGLAAGDHTILSSEIVSERTQYQKPQGATDHWRPRDSRDYRIHHSI